MKTQQTPQVLQQPFAAQGDKNTIPNAATGTNKASLQEGFPPITGQPINQGGIPPERQDFNGAMNLNSQFYFAFQNGWWPTFTQEVSDAIGGYPQGAVLWLFDMANKVYTPLLSLVGNNTYNFNTNKDYIGQYWARILPDSGRGLPLGAIYFSSSSNADDNPGALPLWSGAYYTNASTLYPAFYAWVKSHTELCKSKTEYDTAISTYGECPYYVVDEVAGSLRLPKLVNYLKMANDTDGITQEQAGLPNITGGNVSEWQNDKNFGQNAYGAFQRDGSATMDTGASEGSHYNNYRVKFDASLSSSIYGKSSTVTPAHTTLYPWVVSTASDAESSATAAAQSADAAATSAVNASNSAEAAAQSAQTAQSQAAQYLQQTQLAQAGAETANTAAQAAQAAAESAQAAAQTAQSLAAAANAAAEESAAAAGASAVLARNWAAQTDGPVADDAYSARYYAQQALSDASRAEAAQTAAQTAQSQAQTAASSAAGSAASAEQHAQTCQEVAATLGNPAKSDLSNVTDIAASSAVQTALNGKAATDLSNISWEAVTPTVAFLQKGFKVCLPDVSNGYIDIAENTPYTCPQDGWVWTQGYFTGAGGQTITASVNGNALPNIGYNASSTYNFDSPQWFPVAKGDVWQCNRTSRFYGLRG